MSKKFAAFVTALTLGSAAALAQTATTPAAPQTLPTSQQCTAGYKDGMAWTKDQFIKACADVKAKEAK